MLLLGEKEREKATGPWLGEGNEIWGFGAGCSTRGSPGGPNEASRPQLQRRPFARRAGKSLAKHTSNIPPPSRESRCLL